MPHIARGCGPVSGRTVKNKECPVVDGWAIWPDPDDAPAPSNPPCRACRLTLKLEGDTRQEVVNALWNIATMLERGELTTGVSGGVGSGYIYEYTESDHPTHDEYFAQLRAHLDAKRAADVAKPVTEEKLR